MLTARNQMNWSNGSIALTVAGRALSRSIRDNPQPISADSSIAPAQVFTGCRNAGSDRWDWCVDNSSGCSGNVEFSGGEFWPSRRHSPGLRYFLRYFHDSAEQISPDCANTCTRFDPSALLLLLFHAHQDGNHWAAATNCYFLRYFRYFFSSLANEFFLDFAAP
jgi:hypothetical protein